MIKSFVLTDRLQGTHCSNLKHDLGDFVLKRRDGIINYQLAVVVDDYLQGMTACGAWCRSFRQYRTSNLVGQILGYPPLQYMHLPLAMNDQGQKLSKQNMAEALDLTQAPPIVTTSTASLTSTPCRLRHALHVMLQQAIAQWRVDIFHMQSTASKVSKPKFD